MAKPHKGPDGGGGGAKMGSSGGSGSGGGGGSRRAGVFTISKKTHPLPKIDVEPATMPETSPTISVCETSGSKVTYSQVLEIWLMCTSYKGSSKKSFPIFAM